MFQVRVSLLLVGVFVAAHDMKIEWVIVKGVSHFINDPDQPDELWKSFACTMAASLVSNMFNDPVVFKDWPHFDGKCFSAWLTALRCINPVYQQGCESSVMFVQKGVHIIATCSGQGMWEGCPIHPSHPKRMILCNNVMQYMI